MIVLCLLTALSLGCAQQLSHFNWSSVTNVESIVSALHVFEQHAFPDSAGWSLCRQCGLTPEGILLYNVDTLVESAEHISLSWSQWNEFFHYAGNDKYYAQAAATAAQPRVLVSSPLYVLPLIALHPGHLLIDLLENIYHDMQTNYGCVRKDAVIVLDVAPHDQRHIIDDLLALQVNTEHMDRLGGLIQLFTTSPVRSISELQALAQIDGIVFENIHIGINLERSWYYYGDRFRPFAFSIEDHFHSGREVQKWQREYAGFVMKEIAASSSELSRSDTGVDTLDVLIIVKKNNRAMTNLNEVCDLLRARNLSFDVVDLGELLLHEQVRLLRRASLLLAVAGTAIHNAQFLPSTTSVVTVMPPRWCEFSWIFTNQLILLDLRHFVICSSDPQCAIPATSLGLHRKNYRQGPRSSKLFDAYIDVDSLARVLNEVFGSNSSEAPLLSAHQNKDFSFLGNHHHEMFNNDKLHLIVSSVDVVAHESHTEVNVFFDIIDENALFETVDEDGEHLSDILASLLYLAICCDFPSTENEEPSCLSVGKMNYYASLRLNIHDHVSFSILHCWLQASPSGGFMNSEVFWPIETRSEDSSFHALQCWLIQKDVRLRMAWRNNTLSELSFQKLIFFSDQLENFDSDRKLANVSMLEEREVEFFHKSVHRFSLQMFIPEFCAIQSWDAVLCASFARHLFRNQFQKMISEQRGLPLVQDAPSPSNPFVFLHIEKSAGTTLRSIIANSSKRIGVHSYIPCFEDISCFSFSLPTSSGPSANLSELSVIAGHFFWNIWQALPQSTSKTFNPSCFVMARHPVQRILSFYNQRFFREPLSPFFGRDVNSFSAEEWEDMLLYQRFARLKEDNQTVIVVDEGMSDAACRTLAGIKTTTGLENPGTIPLPPELTETEISQALNNAKECVIGVLEFWEESIRVINHWFPWISFDNFLNLQLNQGTGESRKLRPDLLEITLRNNKCDMLLYEQMLKQFEAQKEILDIELFNDNNNNNNN